jgi:protein-S-isoprenylcysteine O-methyltransferase Ste14
MMNFPERSIENGWVVSVAFLLVSYVPMMFGGKGAKRLVNFSWISARGKLVSAVLLLLFLVVLVYPAFVRMYVGTPLFLLGAGLFLVAAIATVASYINYFTTPLDETIRKGMYRISRNPIYVSTAGMTLGMALMCRSVFMAVLVAIYLTLQHSVILEEEQFCRDTYGEPYLAYSRSVPRYLIF